MLPRMCSCCVPGLRMNFDGSPALPPRMPQGRKRERSRLRAVILVFGAETRKSSAVAAAAPAAGAAGIRQQAVAQNLYRHLRLGDLDRRVLESRRGRRPIHWRRRHAACRRRRRRSDRSPPDRAVRAVVGGHHVDDRARSRRCRGMRSGIAWQKAPKITPRNRPHVSSRMPTAAGRPGSSTVPSGRCR